MIGRYREASVHGRFQPPHNGHMEYLLTAKESCDFLWIGITQFDVLGLRPCEKAPHRSTKFSNLLSYYERVQILKEALLESGVPRASFDCVPFPIDEPERLSNFMPIHIPCLTTVYDQWNRRKIELLENLGYKTIVLYERQEKAIQGRVVRDQILLGRDDWRAMVPPATERAVERLGLRSRLGRALSNR